MVAYLRRARHAVRLLMNRLSGNMRCVACGFLGMPHRVKVLSDTLVTEWKLSDTWRDRFDDREGVLCMRCGSNKRASHLANTLLTIFHDTCGVTASSLAEAMADDRVRVLRIAEVNAAHGLHQFLRRSPGVLYSEYGSTDPTVPSEDLLALTYADDSFDLAITSDTLEHVPDIDQALAELFRILRPGGILAITVPIVWDRAHTVQRACVTNGQVQHLLPASFHGGRDSAQNDFLVFYEFGADILDRCRAAGFEVYVIQDTGNPAVATLLANKPG